MICIYLYIHNIYIWMYIQGNLVDQMCKGIVGKCIFIAIITRMYIDKCAGNILYIYIMITYAHTHTHTHTLLLYTYNSLF